MNRRRFIGNFAAALAGFAVLPPATTYERIWRATRKPVVWEIFWEDMNWAAMATPKHGLYDFVTGLQDWERIERITTEAMMVRYATPPLKDVKVCVPSPSELRKIFEA